MIVERALAKELQISVNHNDLGYLEKALDEFAFGARLVRVDRREILLNVFVCCGPVPFR